jgi:hypothetical protein
MSKIFRNPNGNENDDQDSGAQGIREQGGQAARFR